MALFDGANRLALLIEQKGRDLDRQLGDDPAGFVLHRVFLDQSQHAQRQRFHVADGALAVAARADEVAGFVQRRPQPLPRHFQQAEPGDAPDLHPRAVHFQGFAQASFNFALVAGDAHVDEVDDDQPPQIAQAHLPGDFLSRLQVSVERRLLDVAALGGAGRVDVDGDQRLGVVDDDAAAGRQGHFAQIGGFDLGFDLEAGEQRNVVLVQLELVQAVRHDLLHEILGLTVDGGVIHQNFADVGAQVIPQGADDDVAFLVDQKRRFFLHRSGFDRRPQMQQVFHVPLQLFLRTADAGGAHDQAHAFGDVEAAHHLADFLTVLALDSARDPAGARVVGHQHQVAAGQADKSGQRRALVAAFFLLHLDHDFLALPDRLPDVGAVVLGGGLGVEVAAVDFLEGEKSVPVGAVVHKRGFQTGLDAGDAALVDVGFLLFAGWSFNVEIVELLAVHERHAQLFLLSRIDQHTFHKEIPCARPAGGHAVVAEASSRGEGPGGY